MGVFLASVRTPLSLFQSRSMPPGSSNRPESLKNHVYKAFGMLGFRRSIGVTLNGENSVSILASYTYRVAALFEVHGPRIADVTCLMKRFGLQLLRPMRRSYDPNTQYRPFNQYDRGV